MIITDYLLWIARITANFGDILIFYLLSYKFLDEKVSFVRHHLAFGIAYGLIIGTLANAIGGSNLFQIIINSSAFLMITYLHKKKHKLKFYENAIMYAVIFIVLSIVRLPLLALSLPFNFTRAEQILLVTFLNITLILWLCTKQWLTIFYKRIAIDIFLQISLAMTAFFVIAFWAFNFSFEQGQLVINFTLLILSLGVVTAALYQLIPIIYFYTKELPRLLHDRNTRLMSFHARIYTESICEEAQKATDELMKEARMSSKSDGYVKGDYQQSIQTFIDNTCKLLQTTLEFDTLLHYTAHHQTVPFDEILYMIGTLMTNAIESGRKNYPAFIVVSCIRDHLVIRQSNAILQDMTAEQINKMTQAGLSTKKSHGRGYGLYNLKEECLKQFGGHLGISTFYDEEYQSYYIEFVININAYANPHKKDVEF